MRRSPSLSGDREAILRVLDDPPAGLAELRGVLLAKHRAACATGSSRTGSGRR
jgi:hypothetical protein